VLFDWQALPTDADRFEARLALSGDLSAALGDRLVDVLVLNDVSPLFARRVVLEGRLLLCRDAQAEHDFRRDVQLQAIDLEPFVARSRRRALEALARRPSLRTASVTCSGSDTHRGRSTFRRGK
jgi:hypothetical protein